MTERQTVHESMLSEHPVWNILEPCGPYQEHGRPRRTQPIIQEALAQYPDTIQVGRSCKEAFKQIKVGNDDDRPMNQRRMRPSEGSSWDHVKSHRRLASRHFARLSCTNLRSHTTTGCFGGRSNWASYKAYGIFMGSVEEFQGALNSTC